ncbi:MSMEG_6728 family protein [Nonomuraea roseola]|uniref:MSMEG_6728 family protein n=1 Tax=Nonomuraea roseola TaxID=46179 RepID=A0ABV5Q3Y1_9ACTN
MQTFLPYPDFVATSLILDPRRLGKQRVEAIQVLRGLTVAGYGWRHHPAVAMWAGYEEALTRYGMEMCRAWCEIGYADTCATTLLADFRRALAVETVRSQDALATAGELPPWLGEEDFHRSHRSALLRKDPEHYQRWFTGVPMDLPYVWPVSDRARRTPV